MKEPRSSITSTSRGLVRPAAAALCAAAVLGITSAASADRSAIRLSADIPVGGFEHVFNDNNGVTNGFLGVYGAPFQIGAGALINDNIYVGGRFGFQVFFPDGGDGYFTGRFTGHFEYLFGSGFGKGAVRPYVGADAGFTGTAFLGNDTYGGFLGAGSGGVHVFLNDSVTITPFGELSFQRLFDAELNYVTLVFGATLGGWIWR